ncbi:MAG: hypothetical protein ACO1TE_22350 [Prosthecobacter sp.]
MKNILSLFYIVAFGGLMYWLGTRAVPKHPPELALPNPAQQMQFLAAILNGATSLPTAVSAEDLQSTRAQWERTEKNLQTWCTANSTYPLESFARVAWANCAAALDALQSTHPDNEASQKICTHIMERAAARNADLLAILVRPQR